MAMVEVIFMGLDDLMYDIPYGDFGEMIYGYTMAILIIINNVI